MTAEIALVVAMDENGLIGAGGGMPWRLPADLRHFKRTTMGHVLLMGRKTFQSIGRALPGRDNVVLSRDPGFGAEGVCVVGSPEAALAMVSPGQALMVVGGAQVYELCLPMATRIVLTHIHARFQGDTWFPAWGPTEWTEQTREDHAGDGRNPHAYSFIDLKRR
jgi:dihydrofolate reductase